MALHELDKAATLPRWNLDVGDLTESLEERTKLVLSNISGKATNEDGGVVGIGKLVHRLWCAIVSNWGIAHRIHAASHSSWATLTTGRHTTTHTSRSTSTSLVLRSSGGDSHRSIAAVDALHLLQRTLLVALVGKANEAIAARHSADGVGHDLGRFARWETVLEEGDKNIFIDFGAEVTNEDGVFGATVVVASQGQ